MTSTPIDQATLRERMTAKARAQLERYAMSNPYWVAVYTKRVLCDHMHIEARQNGYGNYECLDCGQAV